jgi:hypothetical protein
VGGLAAVCLGLCGISGLVLVKGFVETPDGPPPDAATRVYQKDAKDPENGSTVDDFRRVLGTLAAKCTQDEDQLAQLTNQTMADLSAMRKATGFPTRLSILSYADEATAAGPEKVDCGPSFAKVEARARTFGTTTPR